VQSGDLCADQGRRGPAYAVLQRVSAAVLLPDDGCDGDCVVESGGGDGHAGGQRECDGGVDQPDRDGSGAALRGARGRQDRRLRRRHGNPGVTKDEKRIAWSRSINESELDCEASITACWINRWRKSWKQCDAAVPKSSDRFLCRPELKSSRCSAPRMRIRRH